MSSPRPTPARPSHVPAARRPAGPAVTDRAPADGKPTGATGRISDGAAGRVAVGGDATGTTGRMSADGTAGRVAVGSEPVVGAGSSDNRRWLAVLPGLALTVAVAVVATAVGRVAPVVGAPVVAIVLGVALRTVLGARPYWARLRVGAAFAGRYVLQGSVVVFGAGLSLGAVADIGLRSLPVMLATLAVCLAGAALLGRALRVPAELRALVGAGTGICGASAIGAVTPVIAASEATVGYAISTIFVYNVAAALLFPFVGHLLGLSDHAFGLWAGTAVNDTSSVVAAGFSFSPAAGDYAVVVKLVRSLMIVPVVLGLSALWRRRAARTAAAPTPAAPTSAVPSPAVSSPAAPSPAAAGPWRVLRLVPVFLWLFLLAALADTVGLVPAGSHHALSTLATALVAVALAGIGTGIDLAELRRTGPRPLLLGGLLWILVAVTSLAVQSL